MTTNIVYGARRGPGETRAMVRDLYNRDRTIREIATITGVSTQSVVKHLRNLRRDGEIEGRRSA